MRADCAAQQAAALLPDSRVVAAFHHVSAILLLDPEVDTMDLDVLVLGDDREATDLVQALAGRIPGVRGIYAGRLRNCAQIEALTADLVSINRRYNAFRPRPGPPSRALPQRLRPPSPSSHLRPAAPASAFLRPPPVPAALAHSPQLPPSPSPTRGIRSGVEVDYLG